MRRNRLRFAFRAGALRQTCVRWDGLRFAFACCFVDVAPERHESYFSLMRAGLRTGRESEYLGFALHAVTLRRHSARWDSLRFELVPLF